MTGKRKLTICILYLLIAPALVWLAGGTEGVAAILVAASTGLAAFVWGNVEEHRAKGGA